VPEVSTNRVVTDAFVRPAKAKPSGPSARTWMPRSLAADVVVALTQTRGENSAIELEGYTCALCSGRLFPEAVPSPFHFRASASSCVSTFSMSFIRFVMP
jgi:hypothetical protein